MTVAIESVFAVGILLVIGGGTYAGYWSFIIWRRLKVPSYRRQAFIVGAFSVYGATLITLFYLVWIFAGALPPASLPGLVVFQESLYALVPALALAWADSSIRVGRRLDPLLRDAFSWSRARLVIWPSMILSNFAFLVGGGLTTSFGQLAIAGLVSALALLGISVLVVFTGAKRAADRNYRRSLEWFVVFLGTFLIYNAGFISLLIVFPTGNLLVSTPLDFVWAVIANFALVPLTFYSMYRCSRSLTPLNKISSMDSSPDTG